MIGIGAILVSVVRPDFMADDVSHDDPDLRQLSPDDRGKGSPVHTVRVRFLM
jgi:hypothetical protein